MIPFAAENGRDENVARFKNVAGEDRGVGARERGTAKKSGGNKIRRLRLRMGRGDEGGDLRFVGVAYHDGDTGEGSEFFRRALRIATCH